MRGKGVWYGAGGWSYLGAKGLEGGIWWDPLGRLLVLGQVEGKGCGCGGE